jgi:Flp pilus assembly protein TadG
VLANATDDVARLFRTGQIKKADNVTEAKLKQMICERIDVIVAENCPGLIVDLRNFNTFQQAADASFAIVSGKVVLRNNGQPDQFKVDLGASMSKNMLRVFYEWPVMTDFLAKYMANLEGNKTLHFATITWQNEPFDD